MRSRERRKDEKGRRVETKQMSGKNAVATSKSPTANYHSRMCCWVVVIHPH